jgi:hypothetical protein
MTGPRIIVNSNEVMEAIKESARRPTSSPSSEGKRR